MSDHNQSTPKIKAPKHLRPATRRWWEQVVSEYVDGFESHHRNLLTKACEAWDRSEQAREILAEKGLTFDDRFGAPHARPENAIERDSRLAFARLIRELQLDVVSPEESRAPRPGPRFGGPK